MRWGKVEYGGRRFGREGNMEVGLSRKERLRVHGLVEGWIKDQV